MTPPESHSQNGDRPSSAEDAFARLLALREEGSDPDFEAWVRQYPEFERELRELDESWWRIERSLVRVLGSPPRGARIGEIEPRGPDDPGIESRIPGRD